MKTRGKTMSQKKVDEYKKEKASRKAAIKRQKLMRFVYIFIALVICVGIGFVVYHANKTVYDINLEDNKFDEPALASALGYSGVNITDYIDAKTAETAE